MQVNNATLGVQLFGNKAPQATANFIALSKKGFYKGVSCHRLTTSGIYVLQCGDPKGDGTGGPGYSFGPIENVPTANAQGIATYKTGYLAMANAGTPDSNGSQFFIVYKDSPLSPAYTVFGQITSGLSGLDSIIKAGVADGSGDGKPKVPTTLGAIKLN
jgi:peptidyl-prolyl cis-trans isomerase B (cyclophilin B)